MTVGNYIKKRLGHKEKAVEIEGIISQGLVPSTGCLEANLGQKNLRAESD
jgi:hypothetical protein